jgi:hypothetical protein
MKTLADQLRDGDPLADGDRLSATDVAEMRRRVLVAIPDGPPRVPFWSRAAAVTAAVLLALAAGAGTVERTPTPPETPAAAAPPEPRQLQFATPGGTRIIWVFDPDFSLQETLP